MRELVQALRSIGENNITQEDERQIAKLLAESPEKRVTKNLHNYKIFTTFAAGFGFFQ